jgi:excisionase family DNA binding protein
MAKLMTVAEVAERLQVSKWTVYRLAESGALPAVRLVPGRLRFDPAAIEACIRDAARPVASPPALEGHAPQSCESASP